MAQKFNLDAARALFATLTPHIHLTFIHPNGIGLKGAWFGDNVESAVQYAREMNEVSGYNAYWTVNIVRDGFPANKPAKNDIKGARFVHVDIDPPKNGGAFDKQAAAEGLATLRTPPSFIIDSGGGIQAFWRLDGVYQNMESIEDINHQVMHYLGADACWNIDRLMRVPGSINYPDKKKQARGRRDEVAKWLVADDGVVYDPQELAGTFPVAPPRACNGSAAGGIERTDVTLPENVEYLTPADLGLSSLNATTLAVCEPEGNDRSADGLAAARLLANDGYTDEQIMGVLLNPANAVAAHFLDQSNPKRAVARVISVVRADGPPAEAFTSGMMDDDAFRRFVDNCKAKVKKSMTPEALVVRLGGEESDIGITISESTSQPRQYSVPSGQAGWLRDLGDNGIARFVAHVTDTAASPQPWLSLAAALATFGTIAGRRYASPTNLRSNLYCIGIVKSGGGKDHPLRAISRFMIEAGLHNKVGGSKIASGQAMITDMTANPSLVYPLDEVGFLFASAADRRRAPAHTTAIIDNLTEFYSMAGSTFLGTSYADQSAQGKPRKVIEQPCLSLFGVTTPGVFWESLSSGNILDGSMARLLIFESDNDYPDPRHDARPMPFPADLVALGQRIDKGVDGHKALPLGEGAAQTPAPFYLPYADENAKAMAIAMREEQTALLRQYQDTNLTSILARLAENATKVALVKAIVANPEHPTLRKCDLEWGMTIAKHSVDKMMNAVKDRVADNEQEAKLKRLHRMIKDAGAAGIAHEDLARQARFFGSRRQFNEALDFLVDGDSVRIGEFGRVDGVKGRRPRRIYFDTE